METILCLAHTESDGTLSRVALEAMAGAKWLAGAVAGSTLCAGLVGGLGLAPGVNKSDTLALYEPTHGTAPSYVGKDTANPGSLILSGTMMLEDIGWGEAAQLIHGAVAKAVAGKRVTPDLARQITGSTEVGCKEFGEILQANL